MIDFQAFTDLINDGGLFIMAPLCIAALILWYTIGLRLMTLRSGGPAEVAILAMKDGADPQITIRKVELDLDRYAGWIRAIVICAPLAGLLGTVDGMIETFDALGDMTLHSQSGGIAGGISQALITTQMGLSVAIPGMLVGRLLDRRATSLKEKLNRWSKVGVR